MPTVISFTSESHRRLHERVPRDRTGLEVSWDSLFGADLALATYREIWISSRLGASPLDLGLPWINFPAIAFLQRYLPGKQSAFEWGMGGSTIFLRNVMTAVTSVEHDPTWFGKVQGALKVANTDSGHQLLLKTPADACAIDYASGHSAFQGRSFRSYVNTIGNIPDGSLDFVLVDGRARMACCRAGFQKLRVGGVMMLDNSDYARYERELAWFEAQYAGSLRRQDFLGPGPCSNGAGWQTSIWYKCSSNRNR